MRWGESFKLGIFFVNREKELFLSVYVDDTKLAGKKQNIDPTWKTFLDHVFLGCTQRECQISKNVEGFLPVLWKSHPALRNLAQSCPHGPVTWKVIQRNVWKSIANLRIKRLNNYTKSRRHAWTIINLKKKKKNGSVGELSTVC